MIIGVPKEIKNNEFRVGLTPHSVNELHRNGHRIIIQQDAGLGSGFYNKDYIDAGAEIADDASQLFAQSELIVKVKEPQTSERALLKPHHTMFTYLHLAPDPVQTEELLDSHACCIAYETVTNEQGQLPLLMPMSEVAGRMSVLEGSYFLQKSQGGRGILLSGVAGVEPANVVIIGGGVVGSNALQIACGTGARVYVLDNNVDTLRRLEQRFGNRIQTFYANRGNLKKCLQLADLLIGAVLVAGASAPKLVSRDDLALMKPFSVIVDVAIDQGGCIETSRPTTHENPVYIEQDIIHYCVANMPGAYPRTSTEALNNATLPFVLQLAQKGIKKALQENLHLCNGLHAMKGQLCNLAVAIAQERTAISLEQALSL
jgi:alanine dehydrogenase